MKRTTIFIDEAVEQDLRLLARSRSKPMAALVREALATYVQQHRRTSSELPAFVAADGSGHRDTAEHHEDILYDDLQPHPPVGPLGEHLR